MAKKSKKPSKAAPSTTEKYDTITKPFPELSQEKRLVEVTYMHPMALKPYWRNPRNHADTLPKLKASIERFGFTVPIIVDGDNVIIAGHGRYLAAKELGLESIPVVRRMDLDKKAAKEFRLADNRIGQDTSWNYTDLLLEARELPDVAFIQSIFDDINFATLMETSVGSTLSKKDMEDFEGKDNKFAQKFEDIANKRPNTLFTFTCPHCLKDFDAHIPEIVKKEAELMNKINGRQDPAPISHGDDGNL